MSSQFELRASNGRVYTIDGVGYVGREQRCQVILNDTLVSRLHATFWVQDGALYVRDERSRNGTLVGGQRLPPGEARRLQANEEIRIGDTVFVAALSGAAAPVAVPAAPQPLAAASVVACPRCAKIQSDEKRYCVQCGLPLTAVALTVSRPAPPAARPAPALKTGLGVLGLPVTRGQIIGAVAAALAGLMVAYILPFVYPVLDPLLT